jgi:hypothetical protein
MKHMHPLEYSRIIAADQYLRRIAAVNGPARPDSVVREKVEYGAARVSEG